MTTRALETLSLARLDPRIEPLLAGYVRGTEGAAEVLHDALLERGLEPLPTGADPVERLERMLALLTEPAQVRIGCASARRVLGHFTSELPNQTAPSHGLATLEAGQTQQLDLVRKGVFDAWLWCTKHNRSQSATRVAWAVWMLVRGMPLIALRTIRAIDPAPELAAQIELVAQTFGG